MGVRAKLSHARVSAQKARLVVDEIRGLHVEKAIGKLNMMQKKTAPIVKKLLDSAIANAENNAGLDIDELYVNTIFVDEAPSFKRFKARAKGRGNRITKRNCHITVIVDEKKS